MTPSRVALRVLTNVTDGEGGCVTSNYAAGSHGYSQVGWHENGDPMGGLCHRIAWEATHGPIPDELTIDHVCRNRRCINVAHLRLLTRAENAADNGHAHKTHCVHGHLYDEANTYIAPATGGRSCLTCRQARNAARPRASYQ